MISNESKLFVYSDMQVKEEKEIHAKIGKKFIKGTVVVGSNRCNFTKIINEKDLKSMCAQYPDTIIVHKGKLNETMYTKPRYESIKG